MYLRCEKSLCKYILIFQRLWAGAEAFSNQVKNPREIHRAPQAQPCCPQPHHLSMGLPRWAKQHNTTDILHYYMACYLAFTHRSSGPHFCSYWYQQTLMKSPLLHTLLPHFLGYPGRYNVLTWESQVLPLQTAAFGLQCWSEQFLRVL